MLLIFDCDGVLVDSEPLAAEVNAQVLTQLGVPITAADVAGRFTGISMKDMRQALETEHRRPLPGDLSERINAQLLARFSTELRPIEGVRDAILALPHRRCVASSSEPDRVALSLRATGLADLFGGVFSSTEVARGKPAPDLFLHAAERMGMRPADCLVIEDSPYGVQAARAAQMPVIGFTGGGHCLPEHGRKLRDAGTNMVIGHMRELPHAVLHMASVERS